MHLALVTHNVIRGDGQGRVNYEIVKRGLARGHKLTLFADRVAPELLADGADWMPVRPAIKWPAMFKVAEFAARADLALLRRRGSFDAICGNGYTLQTAHTVNCVHFVHRAWRESPVHPSKGKISLYGLYQRVYSVFDVHTERRAFDVANRFVAVSRRVAGELDSCGVDARRVEVIYNGVDLGEFFPGESQRSALGVPEGVVGLFVGDLRTSRKNLDSVLESLRHIPELRLVVLGDLKRSPYPDLCRALGIADRVHFLGYRRDTAHIMRACDFLVAPSRYEPFGLIILEAMASGLPVVTAATVGAAELVTSECGFVIEDPEDVVSLTKALRELVADPAKRLAMGAAGRRTVLAHSWEAMADRYWSLFESLQ